MAPSNLKATRTCTYSQPCKVHTRRMNHQFIYQLVAVNCTSYRMVPEVRLFSRYFLSKLLMSCQPRARELLSMTTNPTPTQNCKPANKLHLTLIKSNSHTLSQARCFVSQDDCGIDISWGSLNKLFLCHRMARVIINNDNVGDVFCLQLVEHMQSVFAHNVTHTDEVSVQSNRKSASWWPWQSFHSSRHFYSNYTQVEVYWFSAQRAPSQTINLQLEMTYITDDMSSCTITCTHTLTLHLTLGTVSIP